MVMISTGWKNKKKTKGFKRLVKFAKVSESPEHKSEASKHLTSGLGTGNSIALDYGMDALNGWQSANLLYIT